MNNMNSYPDFTSQGYEIVKQLGANGGRITYEARTLETEETVVVKRFTFENWANFSSYEREIQVLRSLNHPNIPRYIDQFDTAKEFCLVREYINAETLSSLRNVQADEIKHIAISVLEILAYLQKQNPPVIHRDIKPENVLIDEHSKVYLIDFGFARVGDGTVANSSAVAGTFGFMPLEQLYNQQLTKASDLYSLGATLICLLTGTKSHEIGSLVNLRNNRLEFKNNLSGYSFQFIQWLEKMVNPDPDQRYRHAEEALKALQPLSMMLIPEVELSASQLNFKATRLGEKLTQTITINNPISKTILQGHWEVAPHRSDPHTPDDHAWICFFPRELRGNNVKCDVMVDTSRLKADKVYDRKLILWTNASPEIDTVKVRVQTAALPVEVARFNKIPRLLSISSVLVLFILSIFLGTISYVINWKEFIGFLIFIGFTIIVAGIGMIAGAIISFMTIFSFISLVLMPFRIYIEVDGIVNRISTITSGIIGAILALYWLLNRPSFVDLYTLITNAEVQLMCGFIIGSIALVIILIATIKKSKNRGFRKINEFILYLSTIAFGIILKVCLTVGMPNSFVILALAATGLPVITSLLLPPIKKAINKAQYKREIAQYRNKEEHLIEP